MSVPTLAAALFKRMAKEHNVEFHDVRPVDVEFEPYFVAICDCGWLGDIRHSGEEAFRDAHNHSPTVARGLEAPGRPSVGRDRRLGQRCSYVSASPGQRCAVTSTYVDRERAQLETPLDARSRLDVITAIGGG